jgi:hypothetical protein
MNPPVSMGHFQNAITRLEGFARPVESHHAKNTLFREQQVPTREKMQALVAASEKVRSLLNPIAEYNHRLEQLVKGGLSNTDARKQVEVKEPDLVFARDQAVGDSTSGTT